MPVLSEKAKGKQRAEIPDVSNGVASTSQVPMQREMVIRFTEGVEDLVVYVGEKDIVKDLKAKVGYYIVIGAFWTPNFFLADSFPEN